MNGLNLKLEIVDEKKVIKEVYANHVKNHIVTCCVGYVLTNEHLKLRQPLSLSNQDL